MSSRLKYSKVFIMFAFAVSTRLYRIALAFAPLEDSISTKFLRLCSVEHNRKNWLFSSSPKGAAASAMVYTMVEMAKANGLNTYKYLTYLLSQRPNDQMSEEQLEQLAPWSETVKANC